MAETLTSMPEPIRVYGRLLRKWTKVIAASEVDYSGTATKIEHDTVGVKNVAMFLKFANYTGVNVHLEKSYDDGTTWVDVPSGSITATNTAIVVSPVAPKLRISVTATLSASADTLEVWLYEEFDSLQ